MSRICFPDSISHHLIYLSTLAKQAHLPLLGRSPAILHHAENDLWEFAPERSSSCVRHCCTTFMQIYLSIYTALKLGGWDRALKSLYQLILTGTNMTGGDTILPACRLPQPRERVTERALGRAAAVQRAADDCQRIRGPCTRQQLCAPEQRQYAEAQKLVYRPPIWAAKQGRRQQGTRPAHYLLGSLARCARCSLSIGRPCRAFDAAVWSVPWLPGGNLTPCS